jgi:uncharacterized protein
VVSQQADNLFNPGHLMVSSAPIYYRQLSKEIMLKKINWNTFLKDMLRIQIGFALFGLSIGMMIRGNLGTSAWTVLEVAIAQIIHITPGTMSVLMGFLVLGGALLLREPIGWGTLANILCIGPWEDLSLRMIQPVNNNLPVQIAMLLGGILIMGIASAIYIGVDAGAGPRDSLMLAIKRKTSLSIGAARSGIEVTVVLIGWLLGGPAGVGTLVYAFLVGPAVQWGFKALKVQPHRELESEVEDG